MSNYNVKFWRTVNEVRLERISDVCFSSVSGDESRIEYLCKTHKELTKNHISFYLAFIENLLDKNKFTYTVQNDERIMFDLNCEGLTYEQRLLYLTMFRYLCEFAEIIVELFNRRKSIEKFSAAFIEFQKIHFEFINRGDYVTYSAGDRKHGNLSGHGAIFNYQWESKYAKPTYIDLTRFKANLLTEKDRVQQFFY